MTTAEDYREQAAKLAASMKTGGRAGKGVALAKSTSNLFRNRQREKAHRLDVRAFDRVLSVDAEHQLADVGGMTTYERLVQATLKHDLLPTVVPQLKTITVGGAISGVGIESSSFRYGLVHETIQEMDILLGDGRLLTCSREQNADLFFGFPNSYGTLGYALRVTLKLVPAKRYVHLRHIPYASASAYFQAIADRSASDIDFLDGVVFAPGQNYITEGEFCETAPRVGKYTYMGIYYRSIQTKPEDWLSARDYAWRWDTDWFWCSKQFGVQNPVARALLPWALNSRTYQRVMRLAGRLRRNSNGTESVIQDVDIPIAHAEEFHRFLLTEIGILPVWICPFRAFDPGVQFPLYTFDPKQLYINFGFWEVIASRHEPGFYNRKVEEQALRLAGKKGLYSTSYYDEETFWRIYDRDAYLRLKDKYDPENIFADLYSKCVRGRN